MQNLRSVLQKAIKDRLSTSGAAYARFIYALPLAALYLWGLNSFGGYELPTTNWQFLIYCFLGSVAQILFTVVLLWMFSFRGFAVGTSFSKLEVVLIAIMGSLLLGDTLGPYAILAIFIGAVGAVILSMTASKMTTKNLLQGINQKSTWIGLLSAAMLGSSVVFFRGAALALDEQQFIIVAAYTLLVALLMQTIIMGAWFVLFDRSQLALVFRHWRQALPVGLIGMIGSVFWFTAFTLQNAAYVRALGQVELIFTYMASVYFFREKISKAEIVGSVLIIAAVILILIA